MKAYRIVVTPRAKSSITRIVARVEREASVAVSQMVRWGIFEAIRKLKSFPDSHHVIEEISDEKIVFRRVLKWNYKIVYTVKEEILEVIVVQVYHGAQDLEQIIRQLKP